MDKAKREDADKPLYIYRPSSSEIRFVQIGGGIMLLLPIPLLLSAMASDILLCLVPLSIVSELGLLLMILGHSPQQHLAVYEDRLEYRFRGTRTFSRWEDLQAIERHGTKNNGVWGISTTKLEKQYGKGIFDRLQSFDYPDFIPFHFVKLPTRVINPQQFQKTGVGLIPLPDNSERVVDIAKFAETKFGRELKYYAPHLFEQGNEDEKAKNG